MSDSPRFHKIRRELNLNESQSYSIVSIDKSSGPNFSSTPHNHQLMLNDVDLTLQGNAVQPAPDQINDMILETENVNDFASLSDQSDRRINTLAYSINKQRALRFSVKTMSLPLTPVQRNSKKKISFNYGSAQYQSTPVSNISS